MSTGLEGAPILCKRCGGHTEPLPDLSIRCRYCGLVDRLPPDELGRALEIRGRLQLAVAQVAQLASTEAGLASIFERKGAFLSVMGTMPVLALIVVAYTAYGVVTTLASLPDSVPEATRLEIAVASAYGPLFVLGLTVSFPIALLVGRISYGRSVRPLLAARPPFYPGAPMRCRACGADLPPVRDAFVMCRFCRTQNVLAKEVAANARQHLDAEIQAYRARASGALTGTSRASTHMTRTLVVCFVLVYLGIFLFGAVARVAIPMIAGGT